MDVTQTASNSVHSHASEIADGNIIITTDKIIEMGIGLRNHT